MLIAKVTARIRNLISTVQYSYSKKENNKYNIDVNIDELNKYFESLDTQYGYFHHYFWNRAPQWLKNHREYFRANQRAFGEDAFHAMWYLIFKTFKPALVLEIGVYRGSTLSLFSLLSEQFNIKAEVHGISPFISANYSKGHYLKNLDYYADTLKNFDFFNLPQPILHKGLSTDNEMIDLIASIEWDLIFIDGNHDYEVVKQDFIVCSRNLKKGGLLILDDSSLFTTFRPPSYSSAGQFGPSEVAKEINPDLFQEILSVGHNRVFRKL